MKEFALTIYRSQVPGIVDSPKSKVTRCAVGVLRTCLSCCWSMTCAKPYNQSSGSSFHRGPDPRRGEVDRISKAAKCQPSRHGSLVENVYKCRMNSIQTFVQSSVFREINLKNWRNLGWNSVCHLSCSILEHTLTIPDLIWQNTVNVMIWWRDGHFELWDRDLQSFCENDGAVQTGEGMSRP